MDRKKKGDMGEALAAAYLSHQGFEITTRNYRIRTGEIDIVARKNGRYHFVEVKLVSSSGGFAPAEQVTAQKLMRIRQTALHYLTVNQIHQEEISLDVIEVELRPHGIQLNHLVNVT